MKPLRLIDCVNIEFMGPIQLAEAIVGGNRTTRRELFRCYRSEFEQKFIAACKKAIEGQCQEQEQADVQSIDNK